ncbi:hypothetical protein SP7_0025 [Escherichia phage vB_EcoP_SP7]|uniref:Uncharacterized protein n=1 Tax=Escherichia phage vB_EcoP_SP7 TaxID=2750854 RepID=A0A7D5KQV9_9CAUD|nr:hypothetical protein SP7_0025 [Escherichia phage vB_EcoP_SP7]
MAITKRLTCKFDMKIIFTSEDVESYALNMVELTKGYVSGEKQDGMTRKLVETAIEHGVEAAIELHLKSILSSNLKDALQEVYNISTRFKQ